MKSEYPLSGVGSTLLRILQNVPTIYKFQTERKSREYCRRLQGFPFWPFPSRFLPGNSESETGSWYVFHDLQGWSRSLQFSSADVPPTTGIIPSVRSLSGAHLCSTPAKRKDQRLQGCNPWGCPTYTLLLLFPCFFLVRFQELVFIAYDPDEDVYVHSLEFLPLEKFMLRSF